MVTSTRHTYSINSSRVPLTLRVILYRSISSGWSKERIVSPYTFIVVYEMKGNRPIVSLIYSEPELKEEISRTEALAILDILRAELVALPGMGHVPRFLSSILMQGGS